MWVGPAAASPSACAIRTGMLTMSAAAAFGCEEAWRFLFRRFCAATRVQTLKCATVVTGFDDARFSVRECSGQSSLEHRDVFPQRRKSGSVAHKVTPLSVLQRFRVLIRTAQRHSQWVERQSSVTGAQLWALQELAEVPASRSVSWHAAWPCIVDRLEHGGQARDLRLDPP